MSDKTKKLFLYVFQSTKQTKMFFSQTLVTFSRIFKKNPFMSIEYFKLWSCDDPVYM